MLLFIGEISKIFDLETQFYLGKAGFLLFSLLLGHVYRDGPVGNRARDSMLLIFSHSARCPEVNEYIANSSNFCPVLAAGLSGLYSYGLTLFSNCCSFNFLQ